MVADGGVVGVAEGLLRDVLKVRGIRFVSRRTKGREINILGLYTIEGL